mgnify:CR=1 FL=1
MNKYQVMPQVVIYRDLFNKEDLKSTIYTQSTITNNSGDTTNTVKTRMSNCRMMFSLVI